MSENKYEYHLHFWGEIENDNLVELNLGHKEKDFWFDSIKDRDLLKAQIKLVADYAKVVVCFSENQGTDVRLKTIARMVMVLSDGTKAPYEEDFGYAYPVESARYMFMEGNYSCDCNRSLMLGIEELPCGPGDTIKLEDFEVIQASSP